MIQQLIEKYMDGTTSPEEQIQLRRLLMSEDLPDKYIPYRDMFQLLDKPLDIPTDDELKCFAQEQGLETRKEHIAQRIALIPWLQYIGIAASFILVFFIGQWSAQKDPIVIVHELPEFDLAHYNKLYQSDEGVTLEEAFKICREKMNSFEDDYVNTNPHEEL